MEKFLGLLLLSLAPVAFADDATAPAEVIVIGTLHSPSYNVTQEDLLRVLERVNPAVILFELDSSFLNARGKLILPYTLEGAAVRKFQFLAPQVQVLPYDIEKRNATYRAFHYFDLQRDFYATLHRLYMENRLEPEAQSLYREILADSNVREAFGRGRLEVFNSRNCDQAVEKKHARSDRNIPRIIQLTPDLSGFERYAAFESEFWELRNKTMVRNILRHAGRFPGRKIVVLCGFEHRYYLVSHLKSAYNPGISVREFWTY